MTYQDQAAGEFPISKQTKTMDFAVRVVRKGDNYGLNGCLTHDEENPLVEFYDAEYDFTKYGQFVSRYYVSTIVEDENRLIQNGLNLDGGIAKWSLTGDQMKDAINQIWTQLKA